MRGYLKAATACALTGTATPAFAQLTVAPDSGDTGWILTASALVLLMTLPGLALFYGGLVRARNLLSVIMHCFAITAGVSLLWAVMGYSLVFGPGGAWIGGLDNLFLTNLSDIRTDTTIPESAYALFQMTFAVITAALMVGAYVERARFGWVVGFSLLWTLLVYVPAARWIWGGGWLAELGTLDFAGGIVVHTTAGLSAIVVAKLLGARRGFPKSLIPPHASALTLAGAALLWVGWFGFNGGSALGASDDAASAILNTHLAASASALGWILAEKIKLGKPTSIGLVTGAIAGLATITPAAGYVGPMGAILLGLIGTLLCFFAVQIVKHWLKIDDTLDVFAVHGVGGITGSLLLPVFVLPALGGPGYEDGITAGAQFVAQLVAVAAVGLWSIIGTLISALMVAMVIPMRVSDEAEHDGLDIASHGERAWEMD